MQIFMTCLNGLCILCMFAIIVEVYYFLTTNRILVFQKAALLNLVRHEQT